MPATNWYTSETNPITRNLLHIYRSDHSLPARIKRRFSCSLDLFNKQLLPSSDWKGANALWLPTFRTSAKRRSRGMSLCGGWQHYKQPLWWMWWHLEHICFTELVTKSARCSRRQSITVPIRGFTNQLFLFFPLYSIFYLFVVSFWLRKHTKKGELVVDNWGKCS